MSDHVYRITRTVLLALFGTAIISACSPKASQQDTKADEAAVAAAASNWEKAYNEKNADAVAALYTEDAQLLPPGPPVVNGRAAIREFWANDITTGNSTFAIQTDASGLAGDWAWRSGPWQAKAADGSPNGTGKFVEIWHRTPTGWQLHRDIWNVDEAAPATQTSATTPP
jgi:ketosteroid isomerase-like protein